MSSLRAQCLLTCVDLNAGSHMGSLATWSAVQHKRATAEALRGASRSMWLSVDGDDVPGAEIDADVSHQIGDGGHWWSKSCGGEDIVSFSKIQVSATCRGDGCHLSALV